MSTKFLTKCHFRKPEPVKAKVPHNFYSFGVYRSIDDEEFKATAEEDDSLPHFGEKAIDYEHVRSPMIKFLVLMKDTVEFHWKLTKQIVEEQKEDVYLLHEYHKRWQAFVWSLIKIDELLIPFSKAVNGVYSKLYPGFPWFPNFSILRFFVNIWKKEVYQPLRLTLEGIMVSFLK